MSNFPAQDAHAESSGDDKPKFRIRDCCSLLSLYCTLKHLGTKFRIGKLWSM